MIFGIPSIVIEEALALDDLKEVFLFRHKLNFTFHFIGIIFFFFFSRELFGSNNRAILATLIYILHPRIFAHSFFNPKDIIFMASMSIALYPIVKYIKSLEYKWLTIASIAMGISMSCRVVGVYIPVLVVLFSIINHIILKNNFSYYNIRSLFIRSIMVFIFCSTIFYILTPYFWVDPISGFLETFNIAKQFDFSGNVFFFGKLIPAKDIPWYYVPVWIFITTPIIFILFFIIGVLLLIIRMHIVTENNLMLLFCIISILTPYICSILFNSTLYDGWRHFYFIYPFITTIICFSITSVYDYLSKYFKKINLIYLKFGLLIGVIINPLYSIIFMHPFQQVYFNSLSGTDPMSNFDGDYWGTSYRQGLEYLIKINTNDSIYVKTANHPGSLNRHIINKKDRKRLIYEYMIKNKDDFKPDYYITNYRENIKEYELAKKNIPPFDNEIYSIDINGMKILGVYKYKKYD